MPRGLNPFLRSRLAPNRFNRTSLPWRSGEDDPSGKSQGRGRGKKEATSTLFSDSPPTDRPFGKKETIADDVLEILSTWNTDKEPKVAPTPPPSTGARKDTVSEEDIQKLLGTFFSPEKSTAGTKEGAGSASERSDTDSAVGETGDESGDGFYLNRFSSKAKNLGPSESTESEYEFEPLDSDADLDFDPTEIVKTLNTPETAAELGKLLGLTRPAPIHVIITPDEPNVPSEDSIWTDEVQREQEIEREREASLKSKIPQEDAEQLIPQLHYAFTPEDDKVRSALQSVLKADVDPLEKQNAADFEKLLDRTQKESDHHLQSFENNASKKGIRLGSAVRQAHESAENRYLQKRELMDQYFALVSQRKAQKDPAFKAQYERITDYWAKTVARIDELTLELGPDHETVLSEQRALHNSGIAYANLFTEEDFAPLDEMESPFDAEADLDQIPSHPRYQGPDSEANFREDFFNHNVQLLSVPEMDKLIPRDYLPYMEGFNQAYSNPSQTEAAWNLSSIPGSRYQQIAKSVIHEAIDPIDFSKIRGGARLDDALPTSVRSVLGTSVAIAEDEHQSALFRLQLENYMAVQLINGLRGIRDETADFAETARKMDSLSERQKKKRDSQKRSQMKRHAALSEKFGQPFQPKKSIIARAMEAKGIIDQEDVLDQALEILRKEGRKFTHLDIPAIRQQNFQEKFKAIYHNGSIPPMEKAHLVARAISMFIISADELKVMDGALEIFSTDPTELEIQERKAELQRERLTVNYDNSTMSFTGMEDMEFEEEEDLQQSSDKQLFEGYNTSDFETDTDAEVTEPMPEDFVRLKQFKDNAEASEAWAYAVDIPLSALRGDGPATPSDTIDQISKEVDADLDDSDRDEIIPKKK